MPNVKVYKTDGTEAGTIKLSDEVFAGQINKNAMHEVVVAHLAKCRQGTQSALTRSEVRGGGIKPFRQKGTGRARQGTSRSPQQYHGGVVFAPKPRSYEVKVNKKVKKLAMISALSMKVAEEDFIVLDSLKMDAPKTKEMIKILDNLKIDKKVLLVTDGAEDAKRAAGNIPGVKTTLSNTLSVYDILNYDKFIVTKDIVKSIEEVLS